MRIEGSATANMPPCPHPPKATTHRPQKDKKNAPRMSGPGSVRYGSGGISALPLAWRPRVTRSFMPVVASYAQRVRTGFWLTGSRTMTFE